MAWPASPPEAQQQLTDGVAAADDLVSLVPVAGLGEDVEALSGPGQSRAPLPWSGS